MLLLRFFCNFCCVVVIVLFAAGVVVVVVVFVAVSLVVVVSVVNKTNLTNFRVSSNIDTEFVFTLGKYLQSLGLYFQLFTLS